MKIKDAAREEDGAFSMVDQVFPDFLAKWATMRRGISDDDYMVMIETEGRKRSNERAIIIFLPLFSLLIVLLVPQLNGRTITGTA